MTKKRISYFAVLVLLLLSGIPAAAQPFTLDRDLKPVLLQLKPYRDWKDAKIIGGQGTPNPEGDYYYVKGASMFQPIDVYLIGPDDADVKMELVKNNWQDVKLTASTAEADDGIANLKLRTYGDFGIRVFSRENSSEKYQIVVLASPEVKQALASPFVQASSKNTAAPKEASANQQPGETGTSKQNILLYILGAAVLVLIAAVFILLRRRSKAAALLVLIAVQMGSPTMTMARGRGSSVDWERLKNMVDAKKLKELQEKIEKAKKMMTNTKDFLEGYFGMGDCLNMPSPPGMPGIPSFCAEESEGALAVGGESNCATCFTQARDKFNKVRYNFEQLRIIYKCTKDFSDKAIAFGDNVSGVHAVTGLAWHAERAKIEGAVADLKKAYDSKYTELLGKLQESMVDLSVCEAQYGTPDWYDRYGYMFYEFIKEKYKRSGD